MQYVRRIKITTMYINMLSQYMRGHLQRFYNTFGTNDAKLPEMAIFMPLLSHAKVLEDGMEGIGGGDVADNVGEVVDAFAEVLTDEVAAEI